MLNNNNYKINAIRMVNVALLGFVFLFFNATSTNAEAIYIVPPDNRMVRHHSVQALPAGGPSPIFVRKPVCPVNMEPRIFVTPALVYGWLHGTGFPIVAFSVFAVHHDAHWWQAWGVVKNSLGSTINMSRIEILTRCCVIGTNCE
jgi:hypothetical protein